MAHSFPMDELKKHKWDKKIMGRHVEAEPEEPWNEQEALDNKQYNELLEHGWSLRKITDSGVTMKDLLEQSIIFLFSN